MVMPFAGHFNDGHSAARQDVTIHLDINALRILDHTGREIDRWPYDELRLLDEVYDARPIRLKRGDAGAARLTVADHEILSALAPFAPTLAQRARGRPGMARALGLGAAGIVIFVAVVWIVLPSLAGWTAQRVPLSWEEALGERALEQTMEMLAIFSDDEPRFCERPAGRAALDRLAGRLATAAQAPYQFQVSVLDLKMVNAFALPGGRIVFFRGLIEGAESAEEVAGVLAHEMAHVMRRHGTEAILRGLGLQALFGLMLGEMGEGLFGSLGETLLSLSYSREAEATADSDALALLDRAAIRTDGMASFFDRLAKEGLNLPEAFQLLSSHPSHDARAQLFARSTGAGGPAMDAADWQALGDICGEGD